MNSFLNAIAFDTSSGALSAALDAKTGVYYAEIEAESSHSELLLECAGSLCRLAGLSPADLNLVACMKGPGSFTGLRIGFSAAKGLALALNIPLAAIPTLDCIAHPFSNWPGIVLPLLDAKKGCFFTAFYRQGSRLTEDLDVSPDFIIEKLLGLRTKGEEPILLTGTGAKLLYSKLCSLSGNKNIQIENFLIDPGYKSGRARELLKIIKSDNINIVNDIDNAPVYIRKSDAETN